MSAAGGPPTADPRRRARSKAVRSDEAIVRGAPAELLNQPAGEVLANMRWEGLDPDPDSLPAQTFLGWI